MNLTFILPGSGRADIDYTVESAANLTGPWTPQAAKQGPAAWSGSATVTTGAEEGGYTPVSVRLVPGTVGKVFYRLRFAVR